jgi:hypothetical protein
MFPNVFDPQLLPYSVFPFRPEFIGLHVMFITTENAPVSLKAPIPRVLRFWNN